MSRAAVAWLAVFASVIVVGLATSTGWAVLAACAVAGVFAAAHSR